MAARKARPPFRVGIIAEYKTRYGAGIVSGVERWHREHADWAFPTDFTLARLDAGEFDGVIGHCDALDVTAALRRHQVPAVSTSNRWCRPPGYPTIHSDDQAAGRMVAQHFLERGLRQACFVGMGGHNYSVDRALGFQDRMRKAGVTARVLLYGEPPYEPREHMRALLEQRAGPVGVMTSNDDVAQRVIRLCRQLGLRIPDDVAVVGVDDDPSLSAACGIPLSSVELPVEQIGYEAARMLDAVLKGGHVPVGVTLLPPVRLIARQSSDILLMDDPVVLRAMAYIRANVDRLIDVTDLLAALNVSRRSLELSFRNALGRSPRQAIRDAHIERAKQLLATSDLPMPMVADQSGLGDVRGLYRVFRREVGLTPAEYRRRERTAVAAIA